jgi:hypothetical protein
MLTRTGCSDAAMNGPNTTKKPLAIAKNEKGEKGCEPADRFDEREAGGMRNTIATVDLHCCWLPDRTEAPALCDA